ncbi:unnamed protein product [Pleuronectes platessa]|uniref:Uncharacterized protein n=1 Tax=Pleuronectes platessa TaxID=8262 RepID=A0A9N7UW58_PLEPL|nr:unnamed protein product [Pleuronectes platessa]
MAATPHADQQISHYQCFQSQRANSSQTMKHFTSKHSQLPERKSHRDVTSLFHSSEPNPFQLFSGGARSQRAWLIVQAEPCPLTGREIPPPPLWREPLQMNWWHCGSGSGSGSGGGGR